MRRLVVLAVILFSFTAQAGNLEKASRLLEDMRYAKAKRMAVRVLKAADSGPKELVAAYRILGLCHSALGKTQASLRSFKKLLAINSDFRLSDSISPKLAAPFYQAVAMTRGQKPISLDHQPPPAPEALSGLRLKVQLIANPMKMVKAVRLHFWTEKSPKKNVLKARARRVGKIEFSLPRGIRARTVHYFFEALNAHRGVLARAGDDKNAFTVRVGLSGAVSAVTAEDSTEKKPAPKKVATLSPAPPEPPSPVTQPVTVRENEDTSITPWYQTWWFWTAVGVVVAGATTGAVLATQSGGSGSGPADYGLRFE